MPIGSHNVNPFAGDVAGARVQTAAALARLPIPSALIAKDISWVTMFPGGDVTA